MNTKKLISILLCVCMMLGLLVVAANAADKVTITFDNASKRTQGTKQVQVWEENGIKVTNEKGASTNDVNFSKVNPVRFYKNSSVTVEYTQKMSQITFYCDNTYDNYSLSTSTIPGATVSGDTDVVILTLNTPATSFTIPKLDGNQVRLTKIEVVPASGSEGGGNAEPDPTPVIPSDPKEIVDQAFALAPGAVLPYEATLTGKIIAVNDAYSTQYKNVTVTIEVEGTTGTKALKCFRIKGEGADLIEVGDTITVKGTIKNYVHTSSGNSEIEFDAGSQLVSYVKGGSTPEVPGIDPDVKAILDAAYALAAGEEMPEDVSLTGLVTKINTPYDSNYKNVSVTIEIPGAADQPILCYRMKGEEADVVALGDTITVTGRIINYNGTIEFGAGCSLDERIPGENEAPVAPTDPKEIVDAAFALDKGASLPYMATLTGTITEIVSLYDEQYKNLTVNIEVEGSDGLKTIECYRMKGEGAADLKVGDKIAVTGQLTRYYKAATEDKPELDKIEFNSGCTFVLVTEEGGDDNTGDDTTGDDTTGDDTQVPETSDITMFAIVIVAALSATTLAVLVIGKKKLF